MSMLMKTAFGALLFFVSVGISYAQGSWAYATLTELRRGADHGNANAMLELAKRYEEGRGVQQDHKMAERLKRKAQRANEGIEVAYGAPITPNGPPMISVHVKPRPGTRKVGVVQRDPVTIPMPLPQVEKPRDGQLPGSDSDCIECVPTEIVRPDDPAVPPFRMARYGVSWKQYMQSVREASCEPPTNGVIKEFSDISVLADDYAVSGVTYAGAQCFIGWISQKNQKSYRLPTKAEWIAVTKRSPPMYTAPKPPSNRPWYSDQRNSVRYLIVDNVYNGQRSVDGIYGLTNSYVYEMTSDVRNGQDKYCRIFNSNPCLEIDIIKGYIRESDYISKESYILNGITNSSVVLRLVEIN